MTEAGDSRPAEDRGMATTSPVAVPPRGTYGVKLPKLPSWLMRFMTSAMFSYYRNRPFRGGKVLALHTTGAKSGQPRKSIVAYFPEGDNAWLIAASGAGMATHPAWFFNLVAHPDKAKVEIGHQTINVKVETLTGEARTKAWQRITRDMPNFKDYETKTDREIPVVRLTAVPADNSR